MAKDRYAVTCNGRSTFYTCMWEDIRQCAMDSGWAVALNGGLFSDMDIMAMPWVENAIAFEELINKISKLFKDNDTSSQYVITYDEKPHNRIVATIPIFADFYLDISTIINEILTSNVMKVRRGEWIETKEWYYDEVAQSDCQRKCYKCSICGRTEMHKEPYCHCGAKMENC